MGNIKIEAKLLFLRFLFPNFFKTKWWKWLTSGFNGDFLFKIFLKKENMTSVAG